MVMEIRPALHFSSRLSLREFEVEMWKFYLFVLTAFFIVQHGVLIAGKMTGLVIDWSPEKPRAFGVAQVNGE
jgi:hypothetical protein